jgi:hypothetical protein
MIDCGPAGKKTQRDADAVSSLILLYFRVCMHENMSSKRTLQQRNEKSRMHGKKKLEGNRVESFDDKGIEVYKTLKRNHKDLIICSGKRLCGHASNQQQCSHMRHRQYRIQYANRQ